MKTVVKIKMFRGEKKAFEYDQFFCIVNTEEFDTVGEGVYIARVKRKITDKRGQEVHVLKDLVKTNISSEGDLKALYECYQGSNAGVHILLGGKEGIPEHLQVIRTNAELFSFYKPSSNKADSSQFSYAYQTFLDKLYTKYQKERV